MRHNKNYNHLSRQAGHRKALLANMASSLIMHKRIETTLAKAKALRVYVEPLITKSKSDTTHSRRMVFAYLKDKYAVSELFRNVAPKIGDRPGGYTRILKTGFRQGDAADMAMIELVDFNEAALAGTTKRETKKTTRRSRAKKTFTDADVIAETVNKKETVKVEEKQNESEANEEFVADVENNAAETQEQETDVVETENK
jgi:large subunit ribosomal protein L17